MPCPLADTRPFDATTEPAHAVVAQAVEAAVDSAWSFFVRSAGQGLNWDDIHGCETRADYRARLAAEPGLLLETCQALLEYGTGLTAQEQADCRRVVRIADALALRGAPPTLVGAAAPAELTPAVAAAAPVEVAPAAEPNPEPEPVRPRPGRAGRWLAGVLLALGTAAALAWLWNQPTAPKSPHPLVTAPAATAAPAPPPVPPPVAASPAESIRPVAPASPTPRPAPSASSAPRPAPTATRSPEPAPAPRVTIPAPSPAPSPAPAAAPAPAASAG